MSKIWVNRIKDNFEKGCNDLIEDLMKRCCDLEKDLKAYKRELE
jgi:hypothetical protein